MIFEATAVSGVFAIFSGLSVLSGVVTREKELSFLETFEKVRNRALFFAFFVLVFISLAFVNYKINKLKDLPGDLIGSYSESASEYIDQGKNLFYETKRKFTFLDPEKEEIIAE